jgi:hypothetical protein
MNSIGNCCKGDQVTTFMAFLIHVGLSLAVYAVLLTIILLVW